MHGVMDDVTKLFLASFPSYNQYLKHLALTLRIVCNIYSSIKSVRVKQRLRGKIRVTVKQQICIINEVIYEERHGIQSIATK